MYFNLNAIFVTFKRQMLLSESQKHWLKIFSGKPSKITSFDFLRQMIYLVPGVPKKFKYLIDHRTKGFCLINKFSFGFNRGHSNLDFDP